VSDLSLLRVMIVKEFRTTFRERSQIRALLITVVLLALVGGNAMYHMTRSAGRQTTHHVHRPTLPPRAVDAARWIALLASCAMGFFFSSSYLMAGVLASFVGEKEARTLEVLLASPLSNDKLFFAKSASVLAPSALIGVIFALGLAILGLAFHLEQIIGVPVLDLLTGLALGIPAMMLIQLWFIGLGAAISARAETMKGAGQTLGAVFMVLIFGGAYGVPALLDAMPSWQRTIHLIGRHLAAMPFAGQYAVLMIVLAIPAALLMGLGRALFRRDRMLS
jgi:ABC-type Na+ efflux pump permease subunit